ncbi:hypothetical protein SAMN05216406_12851 [Nitrosomonas ureae]|uniref:Uncharacterized protein n=1 Tax=Nitrosomonas ureae TaxID=44577 RepID=A0A286A5E3_9PROT|nr:hypothetical protein C8R28_1001113 [Nitrosomonas ureae]PXX18324.1 hypothetical protein C8R27_10144 [Nitrosomonas ureae]SDU15450.1 hypothetical protein SAMN05216406_12851 [Nitrosomonas ureae]SOD17158.1 hypothetical protein SAMN06297164_1036 [Nitrosomonas ureae]
MMTPQEKLKSLPQVALHFRPGITFAQLNANTLRISDNDAVTEHDKGYSCPLLLHSADCLMMQW